MKLMKRLIKMTLIEIFDHIIETVSTLFAESDDWEVENFILNKIIT